LLAIVTVFGLINFLFLFGFGGESASGVSLFRLCAAPSSLTTATTSLAFLFVTVGNETPLAVVLPPGVVNVFFVVPASGVCGHCDSSPGLNPSPLVGDVRSTMQST
jgi:hypothetical protein